MYACALFLVYGTRNIYVMFETILPKGPIGMVAFVNFGRLRKRRDSQLDSLNGNYYEELLKTFRILFNIT